jgi:hypothetical protein
MKSTDILSYLDALRDSKSKKESADSLQSADSLFSTFAVILRLFYGAAAGAGVCKISQMAMTLSSCT